MSDEKEVTIVIRGKNLTSAEFAAARKDLAGLDDSAKKGAGSTDLLGKAWKVAGAAMAGASIANMAKDVLDYAGSISDLADQTGLSTKTIQQMSHVADMTGTSLDAFTGAAFKLGTALAGGGNSVEGAVAKLNLSYDELRRMSPDQQFETIAAALNKVENAQERNKLAVDLFGKSAKEILPAIAQGYDGIAASAIVAGDAQIKALDGAGAALARFWQGLKTAGVQVAGSALMAIQKYDELDRSVQKNTVSSFDYASALEVAGLKSQSFAKVHDEASVSVKGMPAPLKAATLSWKEQDDAIKDLDKRLEKSIETNKAAAKAAKTHAQEVHEINLMLLKGASTWDDYERHLSKATDAVAADIIKMAMAREEDARNYRKYMNDVAEAEIRRVAEHNDYLEQQKKALREYYNWVGERRMEDEQRQRESLKFISSTFQQLPGVILQAITGGGDALRAVGTHIGTSLMDGFAKKFGPAITAALPFGIGEAVTALLPTLGALFGPVAEKIGDFFKRIFGGPSADELRGRQAVADFEAQLHSTLTATQQLEAGQDSWRKTVVAIRDAYMAVGLSESDALMAAEKLWASSKNGGAASQAVIAEIKRVMEGGASAAGSFASSLDQALRDRTIRIGFSVDDIPDIPEFGRGTIHGYASGTFGVHGSDFPDFGDESLVKVHHREAIVPFEDRISTARRWLGQTATGMAAAAAITVASPNVYVVNDFTGSRVVSESEFKQIQARLDGGGLQVPARAIAQRSR